ncbi:type VI-A CRISPR-associated RNA-guided ribonuclease Cas13a [Pectinatus frisingensis]|uniref:type VI-A CRISPR-associated RNA-guided ribonuclease Cas13a n=1 Tax=Pectinatus frisingensis TaxID=865 RepID=UPI0018C50CF5|nr:type VI-A CRISPR-associated RNA-guided ribonuclease Cas13a [Pectinatus frisingensis]
MKLTRTKNSSNAVFYRDTQKGGLYIDNNFDEDKTENIIEKLPFETSLTTRILSKPNQSNSHDQSNHKPTKSYFYNFINELIKSGNISFPTINGNAFDPSKYLSSYGCKLTIKKDGETLGNLLKRHYEKNEDITSDLKVWHNALQKRIAYKQNRLKESIKNNSIPFTTEPDNKGTIEGLRIQWLYSFLSNATAFDSNFNSYEQKYKYSKLYKNLNKILENYPKTDHPAEKELQNIGNQIYIEVKKYNKHLYKQYVSKDVPKENIPSEYFAFYLNEVQNYFRHYFASGNTKRYLNKIKKIKYLIGNNENKIEESYPYKWVKSHIINKINALLIQNGKLSYYGFDKNKIPTSTDLSTIQVEESFKKQLFLSIAWAVTRLNYFFDYGSNNSILLGENRTQNGISIKGDILSEFKSYPALLKNTYNGDHTNYETSSYIGNFLAELKKSSNKLSFQEKICTTFPIEIEKINQDEAICKLLDILDAAKESISYLRNNIFHPQKEYLYSLVKPFKDKLITNIAYFSEIKELFKKNIDNINDCFKERLSSSLIPKVYNFDILKKIFNDCHLCFSIYSPEYTAIPSFRKVYKRGANICSSADKRDLTWFIDKPSTTGITLQKWQAYKNLIQLLYEYSFLPAIQSQESLVTDFIEKTKTISRKASKKISKNKECYRYNNMPKYNGENLSDYMSELQRIQSLQASGQHDISDKKDDKDDKNYYVSFIQDIFVRAFNNYLETKLSTIKNALQSIIKNEEILYNKETVDTSLNKLFKNNNLIKNTNSLSENDDFCLLFYPFLKMLEKRELATLQQQIIRYRSSLKMRKNENDDESNCSKKLEQLIAIIIFTFPDHIGENDIYHDMVKNQFKNFIGTDINNYNDLYYQNDRETAIKQKSMLALMRTGALPLYADMFSSTYKITKDDYDNYKKNCQLGAENATTEKSPIEARQDRLAILHENLCKNRVINKDNKELNEYEGCLEFVKKYTDLRRKITFDMLYELHIIHVDILGRLAGFAADWERDMHYLLLGLYNLGKQPNMGQLLYSGNAGDIKNEINSIFKYDPDNNLTVVQKFTKYFNNNNKILEKLLLYNCDGDLSDIVKVRNSIAHLNHMTQYAFKNKSHTVYQRNIIYLINKLSKLLNYDIKRKNSITKVVWELLQKYHVNLSLYKIKNKNGKYELYTEENLQENENKNKRRSVSSTDIIYLKDTKCDKNSSKKGVHIQAKDDVFINCIEKLLTFSYDDSQR